MLRNKETAKNSGKQELHGNCVHAKSRSRAGAICQTRTPVLVVSAFGLGILLSSVFTFPSSIVISAVSCCFDHFAILRYRPD